MSIITIIMFFLYTWGLGFAVTSFVRNSENFLERNLIRIGIGLATIPILGVLLNLLHIPLDWRVFLVLALVFPIMSLVKNHEKFEFKLKIKKSDITILIVLLIFAVTLFMYTTGAFSYPYFEDHDPYIHALTAKYVATEKTIIDPETFDFPYIDPYPPAYAMTMGLLHQTSPKMMWTLKFFNALIISLGIIFFYLFAKNFIKNRNKALFATLVLAAIPCYLSHFIWSHAFVPTLFFVGMYCIEKVNKDKKWIYTSIIAISAFPLIQPSQAIKVFVLIGLYVVVRAVLSRKLMLREFGVLVGGYLLSALWWYNKFGRQFSSEAKIHSGDSFAAIGVFQKLKNIFPYDGGTGTRAYSFNDFFVAKAENMINNPVGVGVVISILVVVALVFIAIKYKHLLKNYWVPVTLAWLIFTFLGVNSMTFKLPFGLFAFRFWMLFAIPLALLSVEGAWSISSILKRIGIGKIITLILIIAAVIFTSGVPKYQLNTMQWMPPLGGLMQSVEELQGYVGFKDLEPNTKVFSFCPDTYINIISFNNFICHWCEEESKIIGEKEFSAEALYDVVNDNDYEYLIVDSMCVSGFGLNETNEMISEMTALNKFEPLVNQPGFLLFRVL